jgi:hypothetical protein
VIGRHKFSVGKKFWSWKCSTFNNDIFWLLTMLKMFNFKVARYSYHKNPAQKNRELKTGWSFLRAGRGNWLTKWKELPKWPDVSSCSRHLTSLRVFYSVLYQLLTSLEFSILEKQCAISLYFVCRDLCSNFACCIAPLKTFIIRKIKKFCNTKTILPKNMTFSHFPKKWHYRIFLYFAKC